MNETIFTFYEKLIIAFFLISTQNYYDETYSKCVRFDKCKEIFAFFNLELAIIDIEFVEYRLKVTTLTV